MSSGLSGVLVPPAPPAAARTPAAGAATTAPVQRRSPIPATGAIEAITPQMAAGLAQFVKALDGYDYFQVLGVAQTASPSEIKRAFYTESRTYHPDRFFHLPESEAREHLGTLYKRITEAYFVLRDDAKRKKYLLDITGPERQSRLRYTEATEAELKAEARKSQEEEFGSNPKARPLFKQALADVDAQNWAAAERNLKTGLMYDPGNKRFKELLAEVQKKAEEHRKATSTGYAIK
jgi:DnaJ-class molecular chaperone